MIFYNVVMLGLLVWAFWLWRQWQIENLTRWQRPYLLDWLVYCWFIIGGTLFASVVVVVKL